MTDNGNTVTVLFGQIFSIYVVSHHKLTFKLNIAVCKEGIALDENSNDLSLSCLVQITEHST